MENTSNKAYILAAINDAGIRQIITAASSKADLVVIADKYITLIMKSGFELMALLEEEDIDKEDNTNIFKVYHLYPSKRYRKDHPDFRLIVLELYEIPTEEADDHTAALDRIFTR